MTVASWILRQCDIEKQYNLRLCVAKLKTQYWVSLCGGDMPGRQEVQGEVDAVAHQASVTEECAELCVPSGSEIYRGCQDQCLSVGGLRPNAAIPIGNSHS